MITSHQGPTLLQATTNREAIALSDLPAVQGGSRTYDFPPYSLTALSIPDDGRAMSIWSYTETLADAGSPPQQLQ